jgi:MFS family permease
MMVGVGIGASQSVAYDLFAEAILSKYRSRVTYMSFFSVVGSEYTIPVGRGVLDYYGWRWSAFACATPIFFVLILGYFYLSESPRWLASQGRYKDAEEILVEAARLNNKEKEVGKIILLHEKENIIFNSLTFYKALI